MPTLLLYHDFTSPFCRVALEAAAEVATRLDLQLGALPYELHPAPAPLPDPMGREVEAEIRAARPLARELGVVLESPRRIPRTHKAHEAVVHGRQAGREMAVVRGLYEALWRDGADIGRIDVIVDVAERAGVDRESLYVALGVDEHREAVAEAQHEAEAAGVVGVPTFRIDDRRLTGLVPPADLLAWARGDG